nr:MAG TPA: hypothetical protein [Caudoviricetes sp.]
MTCQVNFFSAHHSVGTHLSIGSPPPALCRGSQSSPAHLPCSGQVRSRGIQVDRSTLQSPDLPQRFDRISHLCSGRDRIGLVYRDGAGLADTFHLCPHCRANRLCAVEHISIGNRQSLVCVRQRCA